MKFSDRLKELGFASYGEYLKSVHWGEVKARYKTSGLDRKCFVCGSPKYQLHHKSYKRLGYEELEDLVPLCGRCHSKLHELLKGKRGKPRVPLARAHVVLKSYGSLSVDVSVHVKLNKVLTKKNSTKQQRKKQARLRKAARKRRNQPLPGQRIFQCGCGRRAHQYDSVCPLCGNKHMNRISKKPPKKP